MKHIGFVLLFVFATAAPSRANQIQVGLSGSPYGPYQTGIGGEFTLNDVGGVPADSWLDLTGYVSGVTSNLVNGSISSFQTFCIEKTEYIYPNAAVYDVSISSGAVNGGVAGGNPDPISLGTAYLYSQFAQGVLAGYSYAAAGRNGSAAALQEAIWWLEQEVATYTALNPFITVVAGQFGTDLAARANAASGQYGVYALNIIGVSGGAPVGVVGQDQLYYQAVPDGGSTLGLLGVALLAVAGLSRRRGLTGT